MILSSLRQVDSPPPSHCVDLEISKKGTSSQIKTSNYGRLLSGDHFFDSEHLRLKLQEWADDNGYCYMSSLSSTF